MGFSGEMVKVEPAHVWTYTLQLQYLLQDTFRNIALFLLSEILLCFYFYPFFFFSFCQLAFTLRKNFEPAVDVSLQVCIRKVQRNSFLYIVLYFDRNFCFWWHVFCVHQKTQGLKLEHFLLGQVKTVHTFSMCAVWQQSSIASDDQRFIFCK